MKKFISVLCSRVVFAALFLIAQIIAMVFAVLVLGEQFPVFYAICTTLSIFIVIYIINLGDNPAYKIAWLVPVMLLPIFGTLLFVMFGKNRMSSGKMRRLREIEEKFNTEMANLPSYAGELKTVDPDAALQAGYIENIACVPVFKNTETTYLKSGELLFEHMLTELRKAERFIFLEYFIISPGIMWDTILEILEQKVKQGVEVRVMYDDLGCAFTLPGKYYETLEKKGIKCHPFNRLTPVLSSRFNNRDHRKICVIDGVVAFTGGVNLADEYINAYEKHGHWLDCGVMLRGEAAWSFTMMFLTMWDYAYRANEDFALYRPKHLSGIRSDGYVIPFTDTPTDDEPVGETVYMNMIARAKEYVYICTPYLIIDNEMLTCLKSAAKSGVDVRIITPHVPDKRFVHSLTRSYYDALIRAGVRIYEYTPGFIHSKTFLSDDRCGVVGSINLDFRSLYLHYECGAWLYGCSALKTMKDEYLETLQKCEEITDIWCRRARWYIRVWRSILRTLAPLL